MEKKLEQEERLQKEKQLPELLPGMRLEVMTMENRLIFMGQIDWVKEDAIQLRDCSGRELPYVEYNSKIKLRGFWQAHPVFIEGMIGGSSKTFWRIDRLHTLQINEQRGYFRQNVKLDATIMCINEAFGEGNMEDAAKKIPVPCYVANISASGAMVIAKSVFAEGDWVYLMDMHLLPDEKPFAFTCIVRRAIQRDNGMEYGCEFCDLESKDRERLIQSILKLQRQELKSRRGDPEDL